MGEIVAGQRRPGEAAPTINELRQQHGVSAGTAHRALVLLKAWGLISETRRGRRSKVLPATGTDARTTSNGPTFEPPTAVRAGEANRPTGTHLELRLLYVGREVKKLSTRADPSDPEQLGRLLTAAARRQVGVDADLSDYELEVRHAKTGELITTFVSPW